MFIGTIGTLENDLKTLAPSLQKALRYIAEQDFTQMAVGEYTIEAGVSHAKLQKYTTRYKEACLPEAHRRYVDIQYVVEGEESVGWCPLSPDLKARGPYDEERDVIFFDALVPESSVTLRAGSFVILYPEDVHRPQVAIGNPELVTKVVCKVSVDSLSRD